jgi:hypothetical protein
MYRTQIYENILRGMVGLINGKKELELPWRGNYATFKKQTSLSDIAIKMRQVLAQFAAIYKKLIDERLDEQNRLKKTIHITPGDFSLRLINLIMELWNDDAIREAFERRREFPKYFVENLPYFIQNIQRISQEVNRKLNFNRNQYN